MRICVICGEHGYMNKCSGKEIANRQEMYGFTMEVRIANSYNLSYPVCQKCRDKYNFSGKAKSFNEVLKWDD